MKVGRWWALAAAVGAVPLQAQEAQPAQMPSRDVVVTGRREAPKAAARRFAAGISQAVDGQVARVRWPICPAVVGVDPQAAAAIKARVREVAQVIGAPVAREGCRDGNLTIIVAPDPRALLADIRRTRPGWLNGVSAAEVARLSTGSDIARAWQVTEILNEDGRPMRGSPARSGATAPTTNPDSSGVALPSAPVLQVMGSSFLEPSTQQAISASFLVVDAHAVAGKSPVQIADYAAMRLLAVTRPPAAAGSATILRLFEPDSDAPDRLTAMDAAYLHALYHTPATQRTTARLGSIASRMARTTDP